MWVRNVGLIIVLAVVTVSCGGSDNSSIARPSNESVTSGNSSESETAGVSDTSGDGHGDHDHDQGTGAVASDESSNVDPEFDLLSTSVSAEDGNVVFRSKVVGAAGSTAPKPVGSLDGAPVWSYVWPTTLDSSTVGFGENQGILALVATSHPDFDDTPLYDEDNDGDALNDGGEWHAHWVVLVDTSECGGGLSVRGIPEGEKPTLPSTWPELPILLDSPDLETNFTGEMVEISVPGSDLGGDLDFSFDGVTSGLRVSTSPHDPLLCVEVVFDVASGDLSLPGVVDQ